MARVIVAPIGVSERFSADPDPSIDREVDRLIAAPPGAVEVLHVGSSVPRKRVDVLLRAIAGAVAEMPSLHLVRVGAPFTAEQQALVDELGLRQHVSALPALDDRMLAAVYRRSALVMLPSDREGFGLPLIEAMACGTPVLASDIPVLREVGGTVAAYCSPGQAPAWSGAAVALLQERTERPDAWAARRAQSIARSRHFTWSRFADRLAGIYGELARVPGRAPLRKSDECPA
jgi:glycosyltransferase involved in cell wall biosynthesis